MVSLEQMLHASTRTDTELGFIVIAALKKQPYASTKILGGTGVDNVV